MNANINPPGDYLLLEPWLNVIRRLRMAAPQSGLSVITFSVVVDSHGNPMKPYPAPRIAQLEPRACAEDALAQLLELLTDGDGNGK